MVSPAVEDDEERWGGGDGGFMRCKPPPEICNDSPSNPKDSKTEIEVGNAMSVARNILKQPKLVPGGGATELTVSATLKQKSSSIEGIEKWPYEAAAVAFEASKEVL
ncbi:hypothetical protein L1887_02791 [Cichorium endivia]|nr:hypothetical protein L1887_63622 [Cichorium endivia]KAI3475032.1 hypothetical protein L1887_63623 [Cichorium endivia]KAI3524133.1 hypothetical protein L1887_02785 [Cichorium endivia]KAI3524135.1 hypothetical protein L1887_02787 [Cichorium endivia]KAI3524137.1 hypothetical protein L1887_02789 [Cichorium endivia]